MGWFTITKTPEELLKDKYLELIDKNGIKVEPFRDDTLWRWNSYKGSINGIKVNFTVRCTDEDGEYLGGGKYEKVKHYGGIIGKIVLGEKDMFSEAIYDKIVSIYNKQQEEKEEERKRKLRLEEEQKARQRDKSFLEEYNRLCGGTGEFNAQFKILGEIEDLGKAQEELLKEWEANHKKIVEKRQKLYQLT